MTPFPDLHLHTTLFSSTIFNHYFYSLQVLLSLLIYIWSSEQRLLNISLLLYINVDNLPSSCPYDLEQTGCMLKKTCGFQQFMWLLIALDSFPLLSLLFSNHIFDYIISHIDSNHFPITHQRSINITIHLVCSDLGLSK